MARAMLTSYSPIRFETNSSKISFRYFRMNYDLIAKKKDLVWPSEQG
jgi:hypothetical protein